MIDSMTAEQYRNYLSLGKLQKSKYRNKPVVIDNLRFMSTKEGAKYQELLLLERAGNVKNIRRQVPFLLQPKFSYGGLVMASIKYIADFVIDELSDGVWREVVIDVKASQKFQTDVYKLKKRMLLFKNPNMIFRESY